LVHGNGIADLPLARRLAPGARVVTVHHVTRGLVQPGAAGLVRRMRDLRGETGLVPLVEGHVMRRADRVIAVSSSSASDVAARCGVPAGRIDVIHHGTRPPGPVSEATAAILRRELCPAGELLVLSVGRLEHRKGTDVMLRAFALLNQGEVPSRLILAGDGPVASYEAMARDLGIGDRVSFLGKVGDEHRDALYAACDLFALASRLEGFGLVVLEAMAAGKAVVVTETGAAASGPVNSSHGRIVPVGDAWALAGATAGMLRNRPGREATGAANRAWVEANLSWRATARATAGAYGRALASAAAIPPALAGTEGAGGRMIRAQRDMNQETR
ncbi:MAG: glycosyltransferase family 4 protein, partial [Chloroflexi bacterium]|nr:glycosyltransferase family 4 protein [Chloroflexota bacterium]